ncbi:MAG: lipid-A-disaccharide synthase, partial [Simkaniaceae bacterium]|nr:lipid-A-disaccharide synthase [Simkaniaceae bacterium]
MDRKRVIYLFAGETSGDDRGAELVLALKTLDPTLTLIGVAGPKMRELGVHGTLEMEDFQVMGFIDVIAALPRLIRLFRKVKQEILAIDPAAVIFIDYPGFNLRMAKALFKLGHTAKRIHYICPSV